MVKIRDLYIGDIAPDMLLDFDHCQKITKVWVRSESGWKLEEASSMREWNREKRIWITEYIGQQLERGGACVAAYDGDAVVGFACMDGYLLGETRKYANLTMLFVDDRWKRKGIGRRIFGEISKRAVETGADKLFISAIPAVESLDVYFSIGCKDTNEIIPEYVDTEYDRYLEFVL